jgi:hypothetical protein
MRFPLSRDESQFRRTNEMRDSIEAKGVQIENVACNSSPWEPRAALAPNDALGVQTLHARSVELVAQPGKIRELGSCVRGVLMDHLKNDLLIGNANANRNAQRDKPLSITNYLGDNKGHEGRFRRKSHAE